MSDFKYDCWSSCSGSENSLNEIFHLENDKGDSLKASEIPKPKIIKVHLSCK